MENRGTYFKSKLNRFINKYYRIKILQGLLISLILLISVFFIEVIINNYINILPDGRTLIFYVYIFAGIVLLIYNFIIPLAKLLGLLPRLHGKQAGKIIRNHFPDVKDKIFNVIELDDLKEIERDKLDLLVASIDQKVEELDYFNFNEALSFKKAIPYFITFLLLIFVIILSYSIWPDFVKRGTQKSIHHREDFSNEFKPVFSIENDSLKTIQSKNFTVLVKIENRQEDESFMVYGGNFFPMKQKNDSIWEYQFINVYHSIDFQISDGINRSENFRLECLHSPQIQEMSIHIIPPKYTNQTDYVLKNNGDLNIIRGSVVEWEVHAKNADQVFFMVDGNLNYYSKVKPELFTYSRRLNENVNYLLGLKNNALNDTLKIPYSISVNPDNYPEIEVDRIIDSLNAKIILFNGLIADDYGFHSLEFIVIDDRDTIVHKEKIEIKEQVLSHVFYHGIKISELERLKRDLKYYFVVRDNDETSKYKSTESRRFYYHYLDRKEKAEKVSESYDEIKNLSDEMKEEAEEIRKEIRKILDERKQNSKNLWEQKEDLKNVLEREKDLEKKIEELKKRNLEKDFFQKDLQQRMDLFEKQQQMQQLLEEVMDDELQQLLDELKEMSEDMENPEIDEKLEDLDYKLEDMMEQMDQNIDILERIKAEEEMEQLMNEMQELAEEMNADSTDTSKKDEEYHERFKEQEERLEENIENLKKEDMNIDPQKKEREDINQSFEELKKEEGENKSQKRKNTSEKIRNLSEKMNLEMGMQMGEKVQIDVAKLRKMIQKLNDLSFEQEYNLENSKTSFQQEVLIGIIRKEKIIQQNYAALQDSLKELVVKIPLLGMVINDDMFHVETSIRKSIKDMEDNNRSGMRVEQQKAMMGFNDLALKIDEMLKQMMNSNSSGGQGQYELVNMEKDISGAEKKHKQMKEQLKDMLKEMKEGMQKQGQSMSQKLAKMLAKREMMRKSLEELMEKGVLDNKTRRSLNEARKMMEEVEKDIANRKIDKNTINRDQNIETKLLEAKESLKERGKEKKRESKEAKDTYRMIRDSLDDGSLDKMKYEDLLKLKKVSLKEYYRKKYEEYIRKIG